MTLVAAEGSETAPKDTAEVEVPDETAAGTSRPSLDSQQVRSAVLVVLAIVVGVVLWLVLGGGKHKPKIKGDTVVLQKAMKPGQLKSEAGKLGHPIYWAGPQRGATYEFTLEHNHHVLVRYLTHGAPVGVKAAKYLIVATYFYRNAYKALKTVAKGNGHKGPGGSFIYVRPNDPRSVLIAWPHVDYEVEVYDPRPAEAQTVANNGQITTVGG
jgi:hypothetical protein